MAHRTRETIGKPALARSPPDRIRLIYGRVTIRQWSAQRDVVDVEDAVPPAAGAFRLPTPIRIVFTRLRFTPARSLYGSSTAARGTSVIISSELRIVALAPVLSSILTYIGSAELPTGWPARSRRFATGRSRCRSREAGELGRSRKRGVVAGHGQTDKDAVGHRDVHRRRERDVGPGTPSSECWRERVAVGSTSPRPRRLPHLSTPGSSRCRSPDAAGTRPRSPASDRRMRVSNPDGALAIMTPALAQPSLRTMASTRTTSSRFR